MKLEVKLSVKMSFTGWTLKQIGRDVAFLVACQMLFARESLPTATMFASISSRVHLGYQAQSHHLGSYKIGVGSSIGREGVVQGGA